MQIIDSKRITLICSILDKALPSRRHVFVIIPQGIKTDNFTFGIESIDIDDYRDRFFITSNEGNSVTSQKIDEMQRAAYFHLKNIRKGDLEPKVQQINEQIANLFSCGVELSEGVFSYNPEEDLVELWKSSNPAMVTFLGRAKSNAQTAVVRCESR